MKIQKVASENLRYVESTNRMVETPTYIILDSDNKMVGKLYKSNQKSETMETHAFVDWAVELDAGSIDWDAIKEEGDYFKEFPSFAKAKEFALGSHFANGLRKGGIFPYKAIPGVDRALPTIENALKVMVHDPRIRAFLEANDPKALEQAEEALALSDD